MGTADPNAPQQIIKLKLVIVGDGAVGKTSLLHVYQNGQFPVEYVPTVFDTYAVDLQVFAFNFRFGHKLICRIITIFQFLFLTIDTTGGRVLYCLYFYCSFYF